MTSWDLVTDETIRHWPEKASSDSGLNIPVRPTWRSRANGNVHYKDNYYITFDLGVVYTIDAIAFWTVPSVESVALFNLYSVNPSRHGKRPLGEEDMDFVAGSFDSTVDQLIQSVSDPEPTSWGSINPDDREQAYFNPPLYSMEPVSAYHENFSRPVTTRYIHLDILDNHVQYTLHRQGSIHVERC